MFVLQGRCSKQNRKCLWNFAEQARKVLFRMAMGLHKINILTRKLYRYIIRLWFLLTDRSVGSYTRDIWYKFCKASFSVLHSDSFTILGVSVSNINESQLQTYESKNKSAILLHPGSLK